MTSPSNEWAAFEARSTSSDDEWADALRYYQHGHIVDGMVISHHRFGFFLDLGGSITGLVEVPMIFDDKQRRVSEDDYPPIGARVRAVVLDATDHNRQIRLGMRPQDFLRALP